MMSKILKLLPLAIMLLALSSCGTDSASYVKLKNSYDSLLVQAEKNNHDLNEVLTIIMEVEDDIQKVSEAENRVRVGSATGELGGTDLENLKNDIQFLTETLQKNKEELERQSAQLKKKDINISALTKKINNLQQQIQAKENHIAQLENELAARDILIQEQGAQISVLEEDIQSHQTTIALQDRQLAKQEAQIYTSYYCFGTKEELKEQNILHGGGLFRSLEVLPEGFNKDYFLQIDSRKVTSIPLYASRARVRTDHPASSYELRKDDEGNMHLDILDTEAFWSLGKYLVIEVTP